VPPADPDGSGTGTFRMIRGAALICYQLSVKDIVLPATGAHIHVGAAGVNGPIVVPLTAPDASGSAAGCAVTTRALVAAILDNPAGYYANVHTTDFPAGAIRGQLG
jgi:CHRD domain